MGLLVNSLADNSNLRLRRQKGAVLLLAVFIVAIIAGISTRFVADFQLTLSRAEQAKVSSQLQQYLYSVEAYASWVLVQDAETDTANGRYTLNGTYGNYDHLQEEWTTALALSLEEATVEAHLEDALSRFNINQLQGRPSPYNINGLLSERFTIPQQRFMRLLQTHPDGIVDRALAQSITESVIDWIDTDNTITGLGGAENNYYQALEIPYRAANQFFISVTELRQIKGISREIYDYLSQFLIALPNAQGFNINTASVAVMRSLNQSNVEEPLTEEEGRLLTSERPVDRGSVLKENSEESFVNAPLSNTAYESVEAFLTSNEGNQVFDTNPTFWPSVKGLRTGSEYFILTVKIKLLDYERKQTSLLKRESMPAGVKTTVIRRTQEQL